MKYDLALLIQAALVNWLVYNGGRMISRNLPHHCLATEIDGMIPVLPWTILIYWGGTLFWSFNYYLGAKNRRAGYSSMSAAHVIGEICCFFAFISLPTTMTRPEITGVSLCNQLLRLTYRYDHADNLLPSIHCFTSWLCWIETRKNPMVPQWYRWTSLCIAIAICISTLTVKQHILVDVLAGILLAEGSYSFAERIIRAKHEL